MVRANALISRNTVKLFSALLSSSYNIAATVFRRRTTTNMAGRKNSNNSGKKAAKPKTTPVAGKKRKADDQTTDAPAPAPVAKRPLPFADGPSAEAPSASPRAFWPGLPEPKRFPERKNYDTNVAHMEAKVAYKRARLDFNTDDLKWCHRERARLSERIELVTKLCRDDADSINTMSNELATLKEQGAEEAFGVSSENFLQESLNKKREESAAAKGGAEAEGVTPTSEYELTRCSSLESMLTCLKRGKH
ncbi:uncharacterized protein FMAN_13707 [Fusarium mangiferae]|uniref:Uncharacterized protein n=1 Tax=Fusarium mangiferae TaxID=192010 RepID=A0A1L7TKI4_FUSMA|nr:uncharacterized protein FMAN_13707 [Fusarium mangiferae]CVK95771.1 uncharacterized protein FMAN_13707 [Fusarium mangiferae]